jgi:hypothetical protein
MTEAAERIVLSVTVFASVILLTACGERKDDRAAYSVCLADAKKDAKIANASFVEFEKANIQASTGDAGIRVNIPYEQDGKKGLLQCVAEKQADGTFKVTN